MKAEYAFFAWLTMCWFDPINVRPYVTNKEIMETIQHG